jgi:hypothetical protein
VQPLSTRSSPASPVEVMAVDLLRSVDSYRPPPGLKQRVRERLLAAPAQRRTYVPWSALVIISIVLVAGTSAALGGRWIARLKPAASPAQARQDPVAAPAHKPAALAQGLVTRDVSDGDKVAAQLQAQLASPAASISESTQNHERRQVAAPISQNSGKVLVFDAMHALRREGQPDRAAKLLDEYLRRYPRGPLAEEALALSIEAARALSDTRAQEMAERYLARYPSGHFRASAERVLARPTL